MDEPFFLTQKQQDKKMDRSQFLFTETLHKPSVILFSIPTTTRNTKHSVVRTLMDRAKNLPSSGEQTSLEIKLVVQALSANNYPTHFLRSHQSNAEPETNANVADHRDLVVLPYAKGCSEKYCQSFTRFQYQNRAKPHWNDRKHSEETKG